MTGIGFQHEEEHAERVPEEAQGGVLRDDEIPPAPGGAVGRVVPLPGAGPLPAPLAGEKMYSVAIHPLLNLVPFLNH